MRGLRHALILPQNNFNFDCTYVILEALCRSSEGVENTASKTVIRFSAFFACFCGAGVHFFLSSQSTRVCQERGGSGGDRGEKPWCYHNITERIEITPVPDPICHYSGA